MGLLLNNWPAVATEVLVPPSTFLYRIRIEGQAMAAAFSPAHKPYREARWALVPGLN